MAQIIRSRVLPIALAYAAAAAAADGGGLTGPVTGFVLDGRANAVRAIEGIPGAARLGAAIRLPFAVAHAAIASRQDYAIVVPASSGAPVVALGLRSAAPHVVGVDGAIEPTSIVLAGSGTAALLHSAATGRLQFLEGLPSVPRALDPIAGPVGVVATALDRAGMIALLADSEGQIWRASRESADLTPIARLHGAVSLSFLPDRDSALAASSESIVLLERVEGAISIRSIAAIPGVRAVQALDSRGAAVITHDGRLAGADLETGVIDWIPLAADAESFHSLDRSLFVLNRAGDRPLLLLDSARGRSAWFVPPEPARPRANRNQEIRGQDRPNEEP